MTVRPVKLIARLIVALLMVQQLLAPAIAAADQLGQLAGETGVAVHACETMDMDGMHDVGSHDHQDCVDMECGDCVVPVFGVLLPVVQADIVKVAEAREGRIAGSFPSSCPESPYRPPILS